MCIRDSLGVAAADHVDGGIDGLQSGGTETIHRLGGHIIGHASAQADQAADVVALDLLAFGAANDDIEMCIRDRLCGGSPPRRPHDARQGHYPH